TPETDPLSVEWKTVEMDSGRRVDLTTALERPGGGAAIAYVMQYVWSASERQVYLSVGHQGGLVAWINGKSVIREHRQHRATGDDAVRGLGALKPGWNRLLIKAESFTDERSVQFRITGLDGQPISGLRFSDRPETDSPSGGR